MATIKFNKTVKTLPVSVVFVDKYLPKANATFVKIYIYAYRHSFNNASDFCVECIAKDLGVLETDVINAFEYWNKEGVIKFEEKKGEYFIEFSDLDESKESEKEASKEKKKPRYSAKEINIYMEQDKSVKDMYLLAEQILARPLSTTEITTIFGFYDWLSLPKDVVLMLLEHCASFNKTNVRYIEKVAIDWAQKEINTVAKAKKHIDKLAKSYALTGKIKSILQISDRNFTETELKYINTWINEYKANEEVIKKAYDITIVNTSKLSYPYITSIIKSWHENGGQFKEKTDAQGAKVLPAKKGFNNYSEERSLNDFEKQMLQRRVSKKEGINK